VQNRLISFANGTAQSATYNYYADGLRSSKSVTTGDFSEYNGFSWADGQLIYEYKSNTNYSPSLYYGTVYNYGLDLVSHYTTGEDSNSEYYYISDAHGDVKQLVDTSLPTLANISTNTYDAFGNGGAIEYSSFGYTGEYHDPETGFIYLRARYYDPTIGRFASEDPHWNLDNMIYGDPEESETLELAPKAPSYIAIAQSTNLYPYCANNPVSFVDPNGEIVIVMFVSGSAGFAVGGSVQFSVAIDGEGNFYIGPSLSVTASVGASVGAGGILYPDMPSIECLKNGNTVSLGISINGSGGAVNITEYNGEEYIGISVSIGTGLETAINAEMDLGFFVGDNS